MLSVAATCCLLPIYAGTRCGLVDGVRDGSTDADTDGDGIPDCLDDLPLVAGTPVTTQGECTIVVDSFADGDDGECTRDCTLREALALAQGTVCTVQLAAGTYDVNLGSLVFSDEAAIVGAGADVTIIDAEIDEAAMIYQRVGAGEYTAVLTGLTLEHDDRGIRHECGNCDLILSNCIVRGDPVDGGGLGLRLAWDNILVYSTATLNNSIVRGGGGIRLAGGGGMLYGNDCLITENGRGVYLNSGAQAGGYARLTDCEVSFNSLGGFYAAGSYSGPSVGSPGALRLRGTVVRGNGASASKGGGIYLDSGTYISGGFAWIFDSTIEQNHASVAGGGIYIEGGEFSGRLMMSGSTLRNNTADLGGGLYREDTDKTYFDNVVENCTFSGNVASTAGGAIYFEGGNHRDDFHLRSCTVAYNEAEFGGGIYVGYDEDLDLLNTILGDNVGSAGGPDCFGTLESWGHNLIGNLDGCTVLSEPSDLLGVTPGLTPLADNGGPTLTHLPEPLSLALDNGAEWCPEADQRGVWRPQGIQCDIGSVEIDPCPWDPDVDGDGYRQTGDCDGTPADCDDTDPTVFPGAPEVNDGLDNQCPGDFGYRMIDETTGNSGFHNPASKDEYSWPAQQDALTYEVWIRRSMLTIVCVPTFDTFIIDDATPGPGALFLYLNHATSPHVGHWGKDSERQDRDYVSCPMH
jgi:CSLREA domain-containing protein